MYLLDQYVRLKLNNKSFVIFIVLSSKLPAIWPLFKLVKVRLTPNGSILFSIEFALYYYALPGSFGLEPNYR